MAKPSPEYLTELFEHHLPYEVEMMRYANRCIESDMDPAAVNIHIEAFCLHVRNLLEFLDYKPSTPSKPSKPSKPSSMGDFTVTTWKPFDGVSRGKISTTKRRLNNQISHLGSGERTSDPTKKISANERFEMMSMIETELGRLPLGLKPEWKASWKTIMIIRGSSPSATNSIVAY
jgi:hypothetical protein